MRRGEGGAAFRRDGLRDHRGLKCTWAVTSSLDPRARQHSLVPAQLGSRCFYCSPWLLALPPSPSSSRRHGSCLQLRSVPSRQKAEGPEAFFFFFFFELSLFLLIQVDTAFEAIQSLRSPLHFVCQEESPSHCPESFRHLNQGFYSVSLIHIVSRDYFLH